MSDVQVYILETIECGVSGEIGLAPQGANVGSDDYAADTDGALIAHDLLEHVNGPEHIGGIGDELEALGAIWFGRGQCGDLNRGSRAGSMYSPQQNIASDVGRMAREYAYKGFERDIPANDETDADEAMRWIIADGIKTARTELAYELDTNSEQDARRECLSEYRVYARNCLAFMQAGFNKAEAMYKTSVAMTELFYNVRDAVKGCSESAEFVGQLFELTILDDGRAFCCEHYGTDDELACDDCNEWFTPDGEEFINQNGYTQCGDCVAKELAA